MGAHVGFAAFDTDAGSVNVGWCEFDAAANPGAHVGWCEFDSRSPTQVFVGWCELDARSPDSNATPGYIPGGGVTRYHSYADKKYEIPILPHDEEEEERIVLNILMEIAAHVV